MIDFRLLVKKGVHFGHETSRWCPRMAPFIWGAKDNVHLIDVSKTAVMLEKAAKFLEGVVSEGQTVLWIGTKKPAQEIMKEAAKLVDMPYVTHRWIGGTLTNFGQVKKSLTRYLHFKDVLEKADRAHYTKKELNSYSKLVARLEKNIGGILNLKWPVGALVVVDVRKERSAIKEAQTMGIPVIALVDTNCDPTGINHIIPGNDDAPHAIKVIIDYLAQAAQRGKVVVDEKRDAEAALLGEKRAKAALDKAALLKEEIDPLIAKAIAEGESEESEGGSFASKKAAVGKKPAARRPAGPPRRNDKR